MSPPCFSPEQGISRRQGLCWAHSDGGLPESLRRELFSAGLQPAFSPGLPFGGGGSTCWGGQGKSLTLIGYSLWGCEGNCQKWDWPQ